LDVVYAADSSSGIPSLLADSATKIFNIFVTFLRQGRWVALEKTTHPAIVYMNPWTREEIVEA